MKKEANFRFSLVRVRENAEAIAFYQGEAQESSQIKERFMAAFNNYKRLLIWELSLNGLTNIYEFIPFVLPAIVVAPGVFGGDVEVGKVSEAQGAFIRVFFSLNVVVARLQSLTAFGAGIDRLYDFSEAINANKTTASAEGDLSEITEDTKPLVVPADTNATNDDDVEANDVEKVAENAATQPVTTPVSTPVSTPVITLETSPELTLQHLTLQTPNYQRILIEDLSLTLAAKGSLLVMGPSGCGKSSLLRAIAGLWNSGEGTIQRPELGDLLFLPQKNLTWF